MKDVEAASPPESDRLTHIPQENLDVGAQSIRAAKRIKTLRKVWIRVKYLTTLLTILLGIAYIAVLLATDTSKVLAALGTAQELVEALAINEALLRNRTRLLQITNTTME